MDTAVTEHIDSSLSGDLTICSRVVSLRSPGIVLYCFYAGQRSAVDRAPDS